MQSFKKVPSGKKRLQLLVGSAPPATSCQPVCKSQPDIDDTLIGDVLQLWMAVKAVHVMILLSLGNGAHLISAHAVVCQLQVIADVTSC